MKHFPPRPLLVLALAALTQPAHAQFPRGFPLRWPLVSPTAPGARLPSATPTLPPETVEREALDAALAQSDTAAVLALLRVNPALINRAAPYNYTPLQSVVQSGHTDMAELLIAHGADINAADSFGRTPLHNVSAQSVYADLALLDLLLAHGANVHAFDHDGLTPLHTAVNNGNLLAVQRFLAHGMSINTQSQNGDTPLHIAAAAHNLAVAAFLLSNGAQVNARNRAGDTPLHAAMNASRYEAGSITGADAPKAAMEELLIDHGAQINTCDSQGLSPLLCSLLNRDKITHAVLLQHHPATDTQTAFLEATAQNNVPTLRRLLDASPLLASARVATGASPLHVAALWNAPQSAALLLKHGASINSRDAQKQTPLHYAARMQEGTPMAAWLLARHADPNAADIRGDTPLHIAVYLGAAPTVAVLLAHHASLTALNQPKQTPLELTLPSSYNGGSDVRAANELTITALLLNAGADPNIRTWNRTQTPVIRAVQMHALPLLRLLLDHGANPSTAEDDYQHNTPLMLAAQTGSKEIVALLLARGADTTATNTSGKTALDIALQNHSSEIAALIRAGNTPPHSAK